MKLRVSDKAPLFSAISDSGERISLADYIGKSNIVLYFYPKDFTMGCTKESCAFRDNWSKILALGATVFGISSDNQESHRDFKKEHSLPFTLLSDEDKNIRRMYGAESRFIPPRVTFVIDKQGIIRNIFDSQLNISKHVESAMGALQEIESNNSSNVPNVREQ